MLILPALFLFWIVPILASYNNFTFNNGTYNITTFNNKTFPNITSTFGYTNSETSNSFKYQGVALGGWLLLEPWITPLLFKATTLDLSKMPIDEYTFCKYLGAEEALTRLSEHWSTFYNETDIADIKNYGFNMIRIPIGYWAFETLPGDPYVSGAQHYLDKAIEWAHKYDLKVWIDLHGAPGSQNGFDNSGKFCDFTPGWQNSTENIDLTYLVLRRIYTKYGGKDFYSKYGDTILGIEVLNEPFGPKLNMNEVVNFYENTYKDARIFSDTNNTIVYHDAFQSAGYWNTFLNSSDPYEGRLQNSNILIDHHHYEIFTFNEINKTISQHLDSIRDYSSGIEKELKSHPAIVGEWSAALTDCTPWLNSVHYGSRWAGTPPFTNKPIHNKYIGTCADINNWDKWTLEHKRYTRKFIEMQLDQYESKMNGWIFWTYKTEGAIEWDFKRLAQYGLFPQPFSNRQYIFGGNDTKPETGASDKLRPNFGFLALFASVLYFF